ncbi:MAG TPA: hypothetical protein VF086_17500 [Propionibacteriaceae bacterium]
MGPTDSQERLVFGDVLRVAVIVMVIAHHAAQAYGPTGGTWPVTDPQGRFAAARTGECLSDDLDGLQSAGMTTTLPSATPDAYGTGPGGPIRARTIGGVGELLTPEEVTRFVWEVTSPRCR